MEFCDNKQQLFQAYFREFQIEEMNSPWKAFTDGWHAEITAKKLGINSSYIVGDYRYYKPYLLNQLLMFLLSYVLVRVSRFRERARLQRLITPNQLLQPDVLAKVNNITVGDTVSVLQFIQKYGTHYINKYVTGNSLYQVWDRQISFNSWWQMRNFRRFLFSTSETISTSKRGWNQEVYYPYRKVIFTISSHLGLPNIWVNIYW